MNLWTNRQKMLERGARLKPCFNTFYNLGQRMAGELEPLAVRTIAEGMNKRRFQTVMYVALGKLRWAALESIKEAPTFKAKGQRLKAKLGKYRYQEAPAASPASFKHVPEDLA